MCLQKIPTNSITDMSVTIMFLLHKRYRYLFVPHFLDQSILTSQTDQERERARPECCDKNPEVNKQTRVGGWGGGEGGSLPGYHFSNLIGVPAYLTAPSSGPPLLPASPSTTPPPFLLSAAIYPVPLS